MNSKNIRKTIIFFVILIAISFCANAESNANNTTQDVINKLRIEYNVTEEDLNIHAQFGVSPQDVLEIESSAKYQKQLPFIVQNAPYSPLLSATPQQQQTYLKYIDNFPLSDTEKEELKKTMVDIWSRMPNRISINDYKTLEKMGKNVDEYVGKIYLNETKNSSVSTSLPVQKELIDTSVLPNTTVDNNTMIPNWGSTNTDGKLQHSYFAYYGVLKANGNTNYAIMPGQNLTILIYRILNQ